MKETDESKKTPITPREYFKAFRYGSLDEMPSESCPEISDFEHKLSSIQLLRSLKWADPEYKNHRTRAYLRDLSTRAFRLLCVSYNCLLRGESIRISDPLEIARLKHLAEGEGLLSVVRMASDSKESSCELKAIRRYILMQHEWNRIKAKNDEGPVLIPLIPAEILSLYKNPWFRCKDSFPLLVERKNTSQVTQAMAEHGFSPDPTDPLEAERFRPISFRNKEDVSFKIFFDTPFNISGRCGVYLSELFKKLIEECREMTAAEYATLLAIKLHIPNMYKASATLCDLMDMMLILNSFPESAKDDSFRKTLGELKLDDKFEIVHSICNKVLSDSNESMLSDNELNYLTQLISRPFLRASYIDELSVSLAEQGKYLDPPEYAVSREKKLMYLVNSKVACSSIKASMLDEEVPDNYTVHRSAFLAGLQRAELSDDERDYFSFTFVRNPFSRLVSAYESKYHVDRERYKKKFDFRSYLDGYLYFDEGFDEFVRKVCALPYRLMDRHFRSQYDLIYNAAGDYDFNYIGHFESLEEDFKAIQNKYRLRPLPHLNRVGTDDWMSYYSPETAALVYRTFRKDIEAFGYEDCYRELLSFING